MMHHLRTHTDRFAPTARITLLLAAVVAAALIAAGCTVTSQEPAGARALTPIEGIEERNIKVTTSTNLISDLARQIGGDRVEVTGLMAAGVDPHLYKASASDVRKLREADLILYGGLELEGKMADLFDEMAQRQPTVAITRDIADDDLLEVDGAGDKRDPHVWFDIALWKQAAATVATTLGELDPEHADEYDARLAEYEQELDELHAWSREQVERVPEQSRVLVTSHDAFHYFGRSYGFQVEGIQGTSTATEATTADIDRVARLIADRELKAVFIESSVPRQTIDAVLAASRRLGQPARVGGSLYSDSAGDAGTPEETYTGMFRANVRTIVGGLA